MGKSIYRKEAIEAHSSQEKVNAPTRIVPLHAWFWLSALLLLALFAVVWGIFGTVTHEVSGQGILTRGGGIVEVRTEEKGRLQKFHVNLGDYVKEGQLLASFHSREESSQADEAKFELDSEQTDLKEFIQEDNSSIEAKRRYFKASQETLAQELRSAQKMLTQLQKILDQKEPLFRDGAITSDEFASSQQAVERQQSEVNAKQNALRQLRYEQDSFSQDQEDRRRQRRSQFERAKRAFSRTEGTLKSHEQIQSPGTGYITELTAQLGDELSTNDAILSFEMATHQDPIKAVIFVPASEGKRIRVGMPVQVSPSTVKRREYGFMKGVVAQVSLYPISPENMKVHLRNEVLVDSLLSHGALIQVVVSLETTPHTKSGFVWSTKKGPPVSIETGTLTQASIEVGRNRPIEFVFPYMKSFIFGQ